MTGPMTHIIQLRKEERGIKFTHRGCGPEGPMMTLTLSPFVRLVLLHSNTFCRMLCGTIASDFDSKLMPKEQNQITMRKVCILIQSFLSHRPDHHSDYSLDHEKHHTFLTFIRRINIIHYVTNVEQHKLLRINEGRLLPEVTSKRMNSFTVVESVPRCFF